MFTAFQALNGPRHPNCLIAQNDLAEMTCKLRETGQAIAMVTEVAEVATSVLGAAHGFTQYAASNLARFEKLGTRRRQGHSCPEDHSCLQCRQMYLSAWHCDA